MRTKHDRLAVVARIVNMEEARMVGKPIPPKPSSPMPAGTPSPGTSPSSPPKPATTPNAGSSPPQKSAPAETYAIQKQPPINPAPAAEPPKANPPATRSGKTKAPKPPARLVSLDAYRGFIMMMLAASGFGIAAFAKLDAKLPVWEEHNYEWWKALAFHFDHPAWISAFGYGKVSFWDLIQPAFMFMVGVSMPFSYARREEQGHGWFSRACHALCRSIVLVLLGVFLSTGQASRTVWVFPNVLCQIGLGYFFAWLLLNQKRSVQFAALVILLSVHWTWFKLNPPPADYNYDAVGVKTPLADTPLQDREIFEGPWSAWSKNGNIAFRIDQWLLPQFRTVPAKEDTDENAEPKASLPATSRWMTVSLQDPPVATPATIQEPTKSTVDEQPKSNDALNGKAPSPIVDETQPQVPAEAQPAGNPATQSAETPAATPSKTSEAMPEATTPLPPAAEPEPTEPAKSGPSWIRKVLFSNPDPYTFNSGGYTTLNFVPSIGTTLLGIICGHWLMSNSLSSAKKLGLLVLLALICFGLGVGAHMTVCPVVKRIWTPSWVLFSGGYVIGMLALFYLLFDIAPLRLLAFPLVVVGTNSILAYMMGQLIGGWTRNRMVSVHLAGFIETVFGPKALDPEWYAPLVLPSTTFLLFWLFLLWLYRQRIFLRI